MAEGISAEFLLMLLIPVTLISFVLTGIAMGQVTQQQQTIQQLLRLSEDCRCARPRRLLHHQEPQSRARRFLAALGGLFRRSLPSYVLLCPHN